MDLVHPAGMPTSIGHAFGGLVAADLTRSPARPLRLSALLFLAILVANLPDLDFLPGALVGHPERFHRGASHSVAAAALAAITLGPLSARLWGGSVRGWVSLVGAAYASHLVLDLLIRDPTGGAGIALLWPVVDARLAVNIPGQSVFDPLRTLDSGFFRSGLLGLLRPQTIQVFLLDGLLVLPLVPLGHWIRKRRARSGTRVQPDAGARELPAPNAHREVVQ